PRWGTCPTAPGRWPTRRWFTDSSAAFAIRDVDGRGASAVGAPLSCILHEGTAGADGASARRKSGTPAPAQPAGRRARSGERMRRMDHMNHGLAALLISFPLLASPAAAGETLREQSQRDLDAGGIASLAVENPRGAVRVSPAPGGSIRVSALKIVRAHDLETAREFARATQVSLPTQGGRCRIAVRYPQHRQVRVGLWQMMAGDFEFPGVEVRLTLSVPRALPVSLRSTSGDLTTEELDARQELDTVSGEIAVTVAGGAVRATTTSGNVRASARGAARLRSVSGNLTAEEVGGPLDAHTTSGELVVMAAQDSLDLGTVSGDIRVDRAPRGIVATTTSGRIEARASAGTVRLS